jgi:hypothetical protein
MTLKIQQHVMRLCDELSSKDNPRFGFVNDLEGKTTSNKTLQ